jgi:Asp-tRNA(Asn)/Glu-tRNA(Gln) amidotransferase A subunit family amidase
MADMSLIRPRPLAEVDDLVRIASTGVHQLVDEVCDRITEVDPLVQAYVEEPGRRTRLHTEAAGLLTRWPEPADRPELFGIPTAVKDIVHVDGLETRAGSRVPPHVLAGSQAVLVDRLRAVGALVVGKSVTAEFASAAPGQTRNPHDLDRTPGGSSSGSAAAVAAGMAVLATGTQTIGSMVRPASFCGVVGWKATHGRIPVDGVIAHSPSFDALGFFGADVDTVRAAARATCDRWAEAGPVGRRPTLGVPGGRYLAQADDEARAVFGDQCDRLRAAGYDVREADMLGDLDEVLTHNLTVNRYELARTHDAWFDPHRAAYRDITASAIEHGRSISRADYAVSMRHLLALRADLPERLAKVGADLLVAPGAVGAAPLGIDHTGDPAMALPWTYAGLPAVSLPGAKTPAGLPLGLQLVGLAGSDEMLLAAARDVADVIQPR